MKFLIIQENPDNKEKSKFRECFSLQRALIRHKQKCNVWGLGHKNYLNKPNFEDYDVIINTENYDSGWVPNLANIPAYKILWAIDSHVHIGGIRYYNQVYKKGKYNLMLQATRKYVNANWFSKLVSDGFNINTLWFPNSFNEELIGKRNVKKIADIGFCGKIVNRQDYLDFLKSNFNFKQDLSVFGENMVKSINSYRMHFNKNISCDINYRNFETIGCGVPLVTSFHKDYALLGLIDSKNCITYKNKRELKRKINFYLKNPEKRIKIGKEGYNLSKKNTYYSRVNILLEYLKKIFSTNEHTIF